VSVIPFFLYLKYLIGDQRNRSGDGRMKIFKVESPMRIIRQAGGDTN